MAFIFLIIIVTFPIIFAFLLTTCPFSQKLLRFVVSKPHTVRYIRPCASEKEAPPERQKYTSYNGLSCIESCKYVIAYWRPYYFSFPFTYITSLSSFTRDRTRVHAMFGFGQNSLC